MENKEVIVIPDGEIGYLSFDMLLTAMPEKSGINYRTLPYALKKYYFTYSSSATIHFTNFGREKLSNYKPLLAFAPNYEGFNNNEPQADNSIRDVNHGLLPMPGVEEEVNNILNIYSGKKFLKNKSLSGDLQYDGTRMWHHCS